MRETKNKVSLVPGEIIISLKKSNDTSRFMNTVQKTMTIKSLVTSANINTKAEDVYKLPDTNKSKYDIYRVSIAEKSEQAVLNAIEQLKNNPDIAYVQPNYIYEVPEVEIGRKPSDLRSVNDPFYNIQYNMELIQANRTWSFETGNASVRVGILDTGIDYTHSDLADNIDTASTLDILYGEDGMDVYNHGTHVAGIIGATGNNNIGVSGVCWNVTMVNIKIFENHGFVNSAALLTGIQYATAENLPIINMSIQNYDYDQVIENAIKEFPGLVVICAGNHGHNIDTTPCYPASYNCDNIIVVGNSTSDDVKHSSSNFGHQSVHIYAPGTDIYSTVTGGDYNFFTGTSMATPHVTGTAALLLSKNPELKTSELKNIILSSVDPIDELSELCVTGGRLNTFRAITSMNFKLPAIPTESTFQFKHYYITQDTASATKFYLYLLNYEPATLEIDKNDYILAFQKYTKAIECRVYRYIDGEEEWKYQVLPSGKKMSKYSDLKDTLIFSNFDMIFNNTSFKKNPMPGDQVVPAPYPQFPEILNLDDFKFKHYLITQDKNVLQRYNLYLLTYEPVSFQLNSSNAIVPVQEFGIAVDCRAYRYTIGQNEWIYNVSDSGAKLQQYTEFVDALIYNNLDITIQDTYYKKNPLPNDNVPPAPACDFPPIPPVTSADDTYRYYLIFRDTKALNTYTIHLFKEQPTGYKVHQNNILFLDADGKTMHAKNYTYKIGDIEWKLKAGTSFIYPIVTINQALDYNNFEILFWNDESTELLCKASIRRYKNDGTGIPANGWKETITGTYYYINGYKYKGQGGWLQFNPDDDVYFLAGEYNWARVESEFKQIEGNTHYFNENGVMLTGKGHKIGDKYYDFDSSGRLIGLVINDIQIPSDLNPNIAKVITIAANEIGYFEKIDENDLDEKDTNKGSNNYTKYARDLFPELQAQPWCDMFVDWCFCQAFGLEIGETMLGGYSAYTPTSAAYFESINSYWLREEASPQIGDHVFFLRTINGVTRIGHVGIVIEVTSEKIYTIEGNTGPSAGVVGEGNGVYKKEYSKDYTKIKGYGRPIWSILD